MTWKIVFETVSDPGGISWAKDPSARVSGPGLGKRAKQAIASGVALASLALASMSVGADETRGDFLIPFPAAVAAASDEETDRASKVWSDANARQAVAYAAGYAFGYEQVYNYGCGNNEGGSVFGELNHNRFLLNSVTSAALEVVTPNNDTLYSFTALALDAEPVVFTAPESLDIPLNDEGEKRYWSNMLQDAASNVPHVLGSGSTGVGDFVIAWKDWEGPLPNNIDVYLMDTPFVWPLIRTGVLNEEDLNAARLVQDGYAYTPLSEYCANRKGKYKCKFPKGGRPEVEDSDAQKVCDRYPDGFSSTPTGLKENPLAFWEGVNVFTTLNPLPAYEQALVQLYKDIKVGPHQPEDFQENKEDYPPILIKALEEAPVEMATVLPVFAISLGKQKNGWSTLLELADYGDTVTGDPYNYLVRGALNLYGPGGLPKSEALYYSAVRDEAGEFLDAASGANRYHVTFDAPPPVGAFWSMTMYDASNGYLVNNGDPLTVDDDIYALGSNNFGPDDYPVTVVISYNQDGDAPSDTENNWLPAPEGGFYLVVRTYVPLDPGNYFPPPIQIQ